MRESRWTRISAFRSVSVFSNIPWSIRRTKQDNHSFFAYRCRSKILADVRRVADDNIGGVGFDPSIPTIQSSLYIYWSLYPAVSPPSPSPSLPQQTGVGGGRNHFINEFWFSDRRFDVILITQPTLSCFTLYLESPCSSLRKVRSLVW
jgi:hypothetical protein